MPDQRPRVTVIIPWLSRAAGGLFDAVRNLTQEVDRQCHYLPSVIGLEDECSQLDRNLWGKIETKALRGRGPRAFGYSSGMAKTVRLQNPDLLHVHGLWRYPSIATIRWARGGK